MDKGTLKSAAEFSIVTAATLGMIAFSFAKMGIGSDFADIIVVNFIGAGFVVIGLACAPFLLISKEHFICGSKDLALPIGLIMACCACFVQMTDLNQSFSIGAIFPAVAGGMISLTLADAEVPKRIVPLNKLKSFLIWLWIVCICHLGLVGLKGDPIWVLSHPFKWILCLLVVYLFCIYNPKQNSIYQRFSVGAMASIILAISLSIIGSGFATESDDPHTAGRSTALGLIGIVYVVWVHISSTVMRRLSYGCSSDTNRFNWHLAEIFTFFAFLILAPKSLDNYMEPKRVFDSEQNVQATEADSANSDVSIKDNVVPTES